MNGDDKDETVTYQVHWDGYEFLLDERQEVFHA